MPSTDLDLALCSAEPIRVPGAIQPHGWLACLDATSGDLTAWSRNWSELFATSSGSGSGAMDELIVSLCRRAMPAGESLQVSQPPVAAGQHVVGTRSLQASVHAIADLIVFEFEPAASVDTARPPMYSLARYFVPKLQKAESVEALCAASADTMKALTGFGRCLVYRFDADGHGEVLAETHDDGYESYLHHHFPASDIPAQARDLYAASHIRLIADSEYEPVPLMARDMSLLEHLDMTHSHLRSVSPVHVEYMRHMRTRPSMSVSIMVRGRLWGLVSCHSREPCHPGFETRAACEHLGQLLALQIEAKEENRRIARQAELRQKTLGLVASMVESDSTLSRLTDHGGPLLSMIDACGAAVFYDDQCWSVGRVPGTDALRRVGRWLQGRIDQQLDTNELSALLDDGAGVSASAAATPSAPSAVALLEGFQDIAGLLAISISQVHRQYIVWFRQEMVQTIDWAGDPRKTVSLEDGRMHPRRSFETWREQVRGRCLPWLEAERHATLELRQALISIVLRRAEEMAQAAAELGRVNKELEAFSYTVSHDLRAPMRHITGYVDLVLESEGDRLSERCLRYLAHVKDASSYAGVLVDSLLEFSRMGRTAVKRSTVKTQMLVDDLVAQFDEHAKGRQIEWTIDGPLPVLWGDPILMQVAVRNLLDNAVKYTSPRPVAHIRVSAVSDRLGDGIEVSDDGVGFEMNYVGKLFGVFQRLHKSEVFEGTGIGLASVKRIVERHGGVITAKGEVDKGATFRFTIPRKDAISQTEP